MNGADRLARLRVQLRELEAYRDLAWQALGAAELHDASGTRSLAPGDPWRAAGEVPVTLAFRAEVPDLPGDAPLLLRLDVGGEALVRVNGAAVGGLNPYHRELPLPEPCRPGDALEVTLEAVPRGLFGTPAEDPRLHEAAVVRPDALARALHEDLAAVVDAAEALREPRAELADLLATAATDTFAELRLPRAGTEAYLARLTRVPAERATQAGVWEGWRFDGVPLALDEGARRRLAGARVRLRERLDVVRERYGSDGALALTGHAHIDLAWLWPLAETRRKTVRTFRTVLALMERYPEWTFNQSMAQIYRWLEHDDPDTLAAIRRRVEEGRWEVVGGMWVEPDGNLLAGESWARQLLYGQLELERLTGRRASVAWLPDTFGYAGNLPQLFRQAGMPRFFTTKLNWNDTDRFPHDLYWWEGIDGSRVLTHTLHNPGHDYNGVIQAADTARVWARFRGKRHAPESLFTYGWGDGGGGPSAEMLERYQRQRAMPGLPALRHGRVDAFFERVEGSAEAARLPVWVGEQYLEFHRGTYTTQARIKALHRGLEHALVEAETAAALRGRLLGDPYPGEALRGAWETLLRNEFHDILPGSSIRTVNEEAERQLGGALEAVEALRDEALAALSAAVAAGGAVGGASEGGASGGDASGGNASSTGATTTGATTTGVPGGDAPGSGASPGGAGGPGGATRPPGSAAVVVWNLSLHDRPLHVSWGSTSVEASHAEAFARAVGGVAQALDGETHAVAPDVTVPGLGYRVVPLGGAGETRPDPVGPTDPAGPAGAGAAGAGAADGASAASPGRSAAARSPHTLTADDRHLENAHLRVEVLPDGTIRMRDKGAGREVFAGPANRLRAFDDVPRVYEAWELDAEYEASGRDLEVVAPPRLVASGPALAAIEVRYAGDGLEVTQRYVLARGGRLVEVHTRLTARTRRTLLRAYLPTTVRSARASFETAFGRVERSTHRNTSWDAAAFEVPALRWADLSEPGYGVGLVTDGTYGYAAHGSTLSLTLLRTPIYPDPYADEGEHDLRYALVPHVGEGTEATRRAAADLNAPLRAVVVGAGEGSAPSAAPAAPAEALPAPVRLLDLGPGIALSALKRAEGGRGLVVRVYEPAGAHRRVRPAGVLVDGAGAVRRTDLMEERDEALGERAGGGGSLDGAALDGGEVTLRPFEVATLRLLDPDG